jgi:hypothetical protein
LSDTCNTIRETPFGKCIGARLIDMTADEKDEIEDGKSRVYFHFDNGETIFATIGDIGSELMGMLDMEAEETNE